MAPAAGRRASRLFCVSLGAWLALAVIGSGGAWASSTETYRDNFDSISYSGSNGSSQWSGNWLESGESDGPSSGRVRVVTRSECVAGSCGRLSAGSNTTAGIHRRADLSEAMSATLTYSYARTKAGGAAGLVRVSVSSDGGGSWSTLATYTLDATDASPRLQSFGITPYLTTQTQVRFRVESTPGQSGTFYFDNVQIVAIIPDPTTTTSTTTTSTTTTPPPTTTTTAPPSSTTTEPPSSTTTTLASTTTGPPSSTTTAPPSSTSSTLPQTSTSVADTGTTTTLVAALGSGAGSHVGIRRRTRPPTGPGCERAAGCRDGRHRRRGRYDANPGAGRSGRARTCDRLDHKAAPPATAQPHQRRSAIVPSYQGNDVRQIGTFGPAVRFSPPRY